jgi:hypothetical protein
MTVAPSTTFYGFFIIAFVTGNKSDMNFILVEKGRYAGFSLFSNHIIDCHLTCQCKPCFFPAAGIIRSFLKLCLKNLF